MAPKSKLNVLFPQHLGYHCLAQFPPWRHYPSWLALQISRSRDSWLYQDANRRMRKLEALLWSLCLLEFWGNFKSWSRDRANVTEQLNSGRDWPM